MATTGTAGQRMPVLFIGHGNPMNALERNEYTRAWQRIAADLPRPRAILAVSAHWYVPGARVTAQERPRTIHDFGGFPRKLYEVEYPAPGSPELARRVRELLPPADVPVVQLGIDETLTPEEHWALAVGLRPLREEGVLVLGSGDVVHNLHTYAWGRHPVEPYDWALRFEQVIRTAIEENDHETVVAYEELGRDAALAAPTPDHFLPLLYVLAQGRREEPVTYPVEGFDGGSVSMLGVRIG